MGVRFSLLLPINQINNIMDKFLVKDNIGDFFSKMYQANKGKPMEVALKMNEDVIQIYYKDMVLFEDIIIVDENPTIDGLVKSLSR